jgi:hypothetical protein
MEIGFDDMDWVHLARNRDCEHGNVPSGSIKCSEFLDELSDWRRLALRYACVVPTERSRAKAVIVLKLLGLFLEKETSWK